MSCLDKLSPASGRVSLSDLHAAAQTREFAKLRADIYGDVGTAKAVSGDSVLAREPINTYENAIWRVAAHCIAFGPIIRDDGQPLPFIAQLVADIFWVGESRVRRDLMKAMGAR